MTTIFCDGQRLFADSRMKKDGETFDALDKITAFDKAVFVTLPDNANKADAKDTGSEGDVQLDVIYGWTYTGSRNTAVKVAETVRKDGHFNNVVSMFSSARDADIVNNVNHAEIVFVGERAYYSINLGACDRDVFMVFDKDSLWTMGSGMAWIKNKLAENMSLVVGNDPNTGEEKETVAFLGDGVRYCHYAGYMDPDANGGMVEVWELSPGNAPGSGKFRRIGLCLGHDSIPPEIIVSSLNVPYRYDWVFKGREKVETLEEYVERIKVDLVKLSESDKLSPDELLFIRQQYSLSVLPNKMALAIKHIRQQENTIPKMVETLCAAGNHERVVDIVEGLSYIVDLMNPINILTVTDELKALDSSTEVPDAVALIAAKCIDPSPTIKTTEKKNVKVPTKNVAKKSGRQSTGRAKRSKSTSS